MSSSISSSSSSSSSSAESSTVESLPDSILCHILSFLPTKDAAITGILSKRWRSLWLSLLTLDFDDNMFREFSAFRQAVYSVLLSQDTVRSLRLKCGFSRGFNYNSVGVDINAFLFAAALKKIENLDLQMCCYYPILLPNCFYYCRNLVVLKLQYFFLDEFSYVDFPMLKSLHLDNVTFESCRHVTKFLCNGCPNLQDFQANYFRVICSTGRPSKEQVEVKSLTKLVRVDFSDSYIPFAALSNAHFFRAQLHFSHCVDEDSPRFHNLTHMELIFKFTGCNIKWNWLYGVLHTCSNLQNLTIHDEEESVCLNETGGGVVQHWKEPQQIVPECLSSRLKTCTLKGSLKKFEILFAKYIIQNSKVLHNMIFHSTCLDPDLNHQMFNNLSLCPRGSATCNLLFNGKLPHAQSKPLVYERRHKKRKVRNGHVAEQ